MFRHACGVEIGDKFVVTGGNPSTEGTSDGTKTVSEYSQLGFVKYLTSMQTARRQHACSKFVKDDGNTVSHLF